MVGVKLPACIAFIIWVISEPFNHWWSSNNLSLIKWSDWIYGKSWSPAWVPGITRSGYYKADNPVNTDTVPRRILYTVNITTVAFKLLDVANNILLEEIEKCYVLDQKKNRLF